MSEQVIDDTTWAKIAPTVPDTVDEILALIGDGTERCCFQMLMSTGEGLVVVKEIKLEQEIFPMHPEAERYVQKHTFHITEPCRDDLYRVYGPGPWAKGSIFTTDDGIVNQFKPGDKVEFTLRLEYNMVLG